MLMYVMLMYVRACVTYKTLGSVHFVKHISSMISSSSKIFSKVSLKTFMSVSNSDKLLEVQEAGVKLSEQTKLNIWMFTMNVYA